ncbi:hypothetical protein FJZ31_18045 [Candidatus Poribacteria bacterium]|nr:hypothetical protein [Candidatus Poribacteria bacterium]
MPKVTIRGKEITREEARRMFREAVEQATPEVVLDELLKELKQFEQKFSMSTVEFYRQYCAGKVGDSRDVMRWAAFYESYMNVVKNLIPKSAKFSQESEKVKGKTIPQIAMKTASAAAKVGRHFSL